MKSSYNIYIYSYMMILLAQYLFYAIDCKFDANILLRIDFALSALDSCLYSLRDDADIFLHLIPMENRNTFPSPTYVRRKRINILFIYEFGGKI